MHLIDNPRSKKLLLISIILISITLLVLSSIFTINIFKIGFKEARYTFNLLGFHIDKFDIEIHLLGIPIIIPLKPKVR